jgi:sugar/nucleoside kinase (ribokinase family)
MVRLVLNDRPNNPRILCAGGAVQDFIMQVDRFPAPGTKAQASRFVTTIGGQAGNASVAIVRLGGKVSYAGPLGDNDDDIANRAISSLEREGIDCRGAVRAAGATCSASLIMIDAAGEKLIATRRGSGLAGIAPADPSQLVTTADAVLLDNRYPDFALPVGRAALPRGIPRVLDFDRAMELDHALLEVSTHVIVSADALRESTELRDLETGLKTLGEQAPSFVAVSDGPSGVYWLEAGAVRHMAAFEVQAIDTLGAGDVFHGAFTLRLVETGDVIAAMRFGAAVAAIKCARFGGVAGTPPRDEVDAFLIERAEG